MTKSSWASWAYVPNKPTVSVDVKQHSTRKIVVSNVSPTCEDIKPHTIWKLGAPVRQPPALSCKDSRKIFGNRLVVTRFAHLL